MLVQLQFYPKHASVICKWKRSTPNFGQTSQFCAHVGRKRTSKQSIEYFIIDVFTCCDCKLYIIHAYIYRGCKRPNTELECIHCPLLSISHFYQMVIRMPEMTIFTYHLPLDLLLKIRLRLVIVTGMRNFRILLPLLTPRIRLIRHARTSTLQITSKVV